MENEKRPTTEVSEEDTTFFTSREGAFYNGQFYGNGAMVCQDDGFLYQSRFNGWHKTNQKCEPCDS